METSLVIMAAGLGSRYGGVKQIDRVGPDGEILMEYAIYDALRAGFGKIIVIIKSNMLDDCMALFGARVRAVLGDRLQFAFQDLPEVWDGIPVPAGRNRPLGTVHALLCAGHLIDCPFATVNADDYYGPGAFAIMKAKLETLRSGADSAMVAYRLDRTVSAFGAVTRGVCQVKNGFLDRITETYRITSMADGTIRSTPGEADSRILAPDTPVSMNLWGLHPALLPEMEKKFRDYLRALAPGDDRSESLLPVVMDGFLSEGLTKTEVLQTAERWFGLTYREDKASVTEELGRKHREGAYPAALWK